MKLDLFLGHGTYIYFYYRCKSQQRSAVERPAAGESGLHPNWAPFENSIVLEDQRRGLQWELSSPNWALWSIEMDKFVIVRFSYSTTNITVCVTGFGLTFALSARSSNIETVLRINDRIMIIVDHLYKSVKNC